MLRIHIAIIAGLVLIGLGVVCSSSLAAGTPGWQTVIFANPTTFSSSSREVQDANRYTVILSNVGGAPTDGSRITLTDRLPAGLTMGGVIETTSQPDWGCSEETGVQVITCTTEKIVGVMGQMTPLTFNVQVAPNVPADKVLSNSVTVSGGGASERSTIQKITVNPSSPPVFEAGDLTSFLSDLNGTPDTQAADHPAGLTTSFDVTTVFSEFVDNSIGPQQDWKDVVVDLPPGVVGNPQVATQCPLSLLVLVGGGGSRPDISGCPAASQVGTLGFGHDGGYGRSADGIPIFNMVPERDEPAEFAFSYVGRPLAIYPTVVGQGADTHIRVTTPGIPTSALLGVVANYVKFFGDPASHDGLGTPNAFFTNPSACNGKPLLTTLHVDSYEPR